MAWRSSNRWFGLLAAVVACGPAASRPQQHDTALARSVISDRAVAAGSLYGESFIRGRHAGVDFRAKRGDRVTAVLDGVVTSVTTRSGIGCGRAIMIVDRRQEVFVVYCHLLFVWALPGQKVRVGDVIGAVGATGTRFDHVHLEVCTEPCPRGHADGDLRGTIDPLAWLAEHQLAGPVREDGSLLNPIDLCEPDETRRQYGMLRASEVIRLNATLTTEADRPGLVPFFGTPFEPWARAQLAYGRFDDSGAHRRWLEENCAPLARLAHLPDPGTGI